MFGFVDNGVVETLQCESVVKSLVLPTHRPSHKNQLQTIKYTWSKKEKKYFIARRIVDVTNVRAKHYWIDIRTNSIRYR